MPISDDELPELLETLSEDIKECFATSLTSRIGGNDPLTFGLLEQNGELNTDLNAFAKSDEIAVVPWTYSCTHTGAFVGVAPTYIDVELRGATFVDIRADDHRDWIFYRYVDYLGALQQIGVTTASRPSVDPAEFVNWQENWNAGREERARLRDEAAESDPDEPLG